MVVVEGRKVDESEPAAGVMLNEVPGYVMLAEIALVEDHTRFETPPAMMVDDGEKLSAQVGAGLAGGGVVTVIVADAVAVPVLGAPPQERPNIVVAVGLTTAEPDVVPPVEKPPPMHDVAPVDDHESVDDCPC